MGEKVLSLMCSAKVLLVNSSTLVDMLNDEMILRRIQTIISELQV